MYLSVFFLKQRGKANQFLRREFFHQPVNHVGGHFGKVQQHLRADRTGKLCLIAFAEIGEIGELVNVGLQNVALFAGEQYGRRVSDGFENLLRLLPERLDNARVFLRGNGDKGPFVGVGRFVQLKETAFVAVVLSRPMGAVAAGGTADGTAAGLDGTSDTDLLFDSSVDFRDQRGVFGGAQHVSVGKQIRVIRAQGVFAGRIKDHPRVVDSRRLVSRFGIVVENAGFADEKLRQGLQGFFGKPFAVAVDVVVAEDDAEGVYLVGGQRVPRVGVDFLQVALFGQSAFLNGSNGINETQLLW